MGWALRKTLTLHQPRLLDILIPGTQKLESAALRQKHHEVFRPFHHYPHDVPEDVMGNLEGIALHLTISLEARHFRLQNRHDYIQKSAACPLVGRNLFGVGSVVVARDCQYGLAVVAIKSNRTLIGMLLLRFVEIQLAVQIEVILERERLNILTHDLQIVDVLLLQRAQIWILDLRGRENLRRAHSRRPQQESAPAA